MIIVSGANGNLGRAVVQRLLDRVEPERIGVCVRDPERAADLARRGVRVRKGAFADATSLAHAFEGASRVLVVSVDSHGSAAVRLHGTAIAAAGQAGASRVVYTSHMGASPTSHFAPMVDHAATEVALRSSGVAFTSLRNGFYAASALMLLGGAAETGELVAPEDGPVSWTSHDDLASAAAIALTEDVLDGVTPALTGAEAIDLTGVAEIASRVTGRTIRRVVVSDAEYRAGLVARGLPGHTADLLVGLFAASRRGEFARVDPALSDLVGRPTVPLEDIVKSSL
ncbi:NAD(P)H-binding protein [Saccharothrix sp. S26]|uniref:NAD(P)H-binding protein n=1 Tax=Saccharothrix sp. S26 TaxID=2907215 RepID=UPI001F25BF34|nr:NAD(P)H-binding protein [Saccharothrix sp. S26]MCE7000992.1 NAD(P)H-binding protein [Saccharothrix sp. S26]